MCIRDSLTGFVLRPGFGDPVDRYRVESLWKLITAGASAGAGVGSGGKKQPVVPEGGADYWIMWRRVGGGLNAALQQQLFSRLKPALLPVKGKAYSRPPANEYAEMWRTAASLERLDAKTKEALGAAVLKDCKKTPVPTYAFWSLTRLGGRVLLYGPLNAVVHPDIVEQWIEELLPFQPTNDSERNGWLFCLAELARQSGLRAVDVSDLTRNRVLGVLRSHTTVTRETPSSPRRHVGREAFHSKEGTRMSRAMLAVAAGLLSYSGALAAEPLQVDRKIAKEPAYATKSPRYGLMLFGPEGKDRVWFVHDGDTLYVDRNGNGDLTEAGEKVAAGKPKNGREPDEGVFSFEVGDLTVGGKTHKSVGVYLSRLARYESPSFANRPDVKAALAKDPKASVAIVSADVAVEGVKGGGTDGRLSFTAGFLDLNGVLQLAEKPADAPVVHFGGPLEITFYAELPNLRVGRDNEMVLVVGTPGIGPGTFAMLAYQDTIPETAKPVAEITYQPAKPGEPPVKEKFEIKERC